MASCADRAAAEAAGMERSATGPSNTLGVLPPQRSAHGACVDRITSEQRSRVMSRIRSRDTGPERSLRRALADAGIRGWRKHHRAVVGVSSADIAFTRWKVAVFVDGCFWHGHPKFFTPGKSGIYWDEKIARNQARDRKTNHAYRHAGWRVVRAWDFEVEQSPEGVASRVARALRSRGRWKRSQ